MPGLQENNRQGQMEGTPMLSLHEQMAALRHEGKTLKQIGHTVGRSHSTVSYHLNGECRCPGPEYVYVPAKWFRCHKCGGGFLSRNGCRHEWGLTL